ncbi:MAG: DUF2236 domain-containing protein [Deltaproteobacteria bacterium]|nr:DUF2236 domain-containing protein [Deltaproteobacteria bacterium]
MHTIASRAPRWLDRAQQIGDPLVDVLVARTLREAPSAELDAALGRVCRDPRAPLDALPAPLARYFETQGVPEWADHARLRQAATFGERHAVAISTALFCAAVRDRESGPLASRGASILGATGCLEADLDRRVHETGRFVFDVLTPGGFESGRAVRSAQCIRLVHGVVRAGVLEGRAQRRERDLEMPIHQEALLDALSCFSVGVLDALAKMGIAFTRSEAEDYVHLWRVVGAMLGIREAWLPRDLSAMRRLSSFLRARSFEPSLAARGRTRVVVTGIEDPPSHGTLAPSLVRYFLGGHGGVPEGLRAPHVAELLPRVTSYLGRMGHGSLGDALPAIGRAILEGVMAHELARREPTFYRPLSLATMHRGTCPHRTRSA